MWAPFWAHRTRIGGDGSTVATSLTIPPRMAETTSLIGIRAPRGRRINGKATSQGTISFTGHKCGIQCGRGRKRRLSCQFGIKRLQWTNGGLALHRLRFPSNVCYACLTLVNWLNISSGIAFKREGHGDGQRISCTNYAGLGPVIMIASIGSKWYSGKEFPKGMAKWLKFGTSSGASLFGPFGLNRMTRCLTKHNGMKLSLSNIFGMLWLFMLKWHGRGCWNKSRLVVSQKRPCYVASTRRGVLGEFFVDGMTCTWIGTGEGIVGREVWPPWGLGGLGGGVVLGRGRVLVFMWRCSHARGVSPPLCEGVWFSFVVFILALARLAFCLEERKNWHIKLTWFVCLECMWWTMSRENWYLV